MNDKRERILDIVAIIVCTIAIALIQYIGAN